jgi:hypothetical protein
MVDAVLDSLFESILNELECALGIASSADRDQQLNTLAEHAERICHLTASAKMLARQNSSGPHQNPLD